MKEKENTMNSSNIETEYLDIAMRSAWPLVYQKINRECQAYPYTCIEAKKPQNKQLNRYRDVNPYDHSRVVLERSECDYINANLVKMEKAERRYILTQGPLSFTVGHFWLMIWEQNSRAILMLNKLIEKNQIKCHLYWPPSRGDDNILELRAVRLAVELISEHDYQYFIIRKFKLHDRESNKSREVVQFHYTTWPDFGVPSSPGTFLDFLKKVRASGGLSAEVGPAVVHCSAGIGRSGTFCLVDSCLVLIEKEGINNVNVQDILLDMRKDRMGLIQTPEQLRFSYLAIIEGAQRLDPNWKEEKIDDSESIYCTVAETEDEAPPPPPRAESLTRPPARPLPAIPSSASMGTLSFPTAATVEAEAEEEIESSSSDSSPPTPPARELELDHSQSSDAEATSADDEDAGEPLVAPKHTGSAESGAGAGASEASEVRRRRAAALAERVTAIKRRARDAERWHKLKRCRTRPQENGDDSLQQED